MNYRANPKGYKRIQGGFYQGWTLSGNWLYVYKVGRRWFYRKFLYPRTPAEVISMHGSIPRSNGGFATRAMAVSAAAGYRAK